MKKRIIALGACVIAVVMILVSCGGGGVSIAADVASDGRTAELTFNKASSGDFVMTGSVEVGENEQVVFDMEIEDGGEAVVRFIPAPEDADIDDPEGALEAIDAENYTLEVVLSGSGTSAFSLDPGSYMLNIETTSKTTGTASLRVEAL